MSEEPNTGDGEPADPIVDYSRVKQNEAMEWYAIGYSSNGEIVVTTEGYENRAHALEVAAELGPIRDED